jgi:hypothetical protein
MQEEKRACVFLHPVVVATDRRADRLIAALGVKRGRRFET